MPRELRWILILSEDSFLRKIDTLSPEARDALIALRMKADAAFFAQHALPHHCRLPFAEVHRQLFQWHEVMGQEPLEERRGLRYALAAPRGSAKSTIVSLVLVLHDILFDRERYILLLSATERQARQRLRAIRAELEGGFCGDVLSGLPRHFSAGKLQIGGIRIDAFGAGTEIRGLNEEGYRPTKIILDDADASSAATSSRARERLASWFTEVVEHLGDVYTHILAIGTVLHERCLLASLLQRPDFESFRARSIERFSLRDDLWGEWRRRLMDLSDPVRRQTARGYFEKHREGMEWGTKVLWREKEDYEDLMAQLTLQGRRAFYQEKQNMPLGREEAVFDAAGALRGFWEGNDLRVSAPGADGERLVRVVRKAAVTGRRFGYLDAALGKGARSGRGDFAALATVVLLPDGTLFLEDLWARRAPPSDQVQHLFRRHLAVPFEVFGVEGTGFQELLMMPIEEERRRRGMVLPIRVIHPKRNKGARIAMLEPLLCNGTLVVGGGLAEEFWEELAAWPVCEHDDALDAVAGAVELALAGCLKTGNWTSTGERSSPPGMSF